MGIDGPAERYDRMEEAKYVAISVLPKLGEQLITIGDKKVPASLLVKEVQAGSELGLATVAYFRQDMDAHGGTYQDPWRTPGERSETMMLQQEKTRKALLQTSGLSKPHAVSQATPPKKP